MFFYYGGKRALAARYDAPAYPLIIEPFAGAAAYSMHYLHAVERVVLLEKDERVVRLWRRLLAMEPADVAALPVPRVGDETADFLHMTAATSNAIGHSRRMTVTERMPEKIRLMLRGIADALPEAKRKVEVVHGDYRDAPDVEATWFVDPPYQPTRGDKSGQGYGYGPGCTARELDYAELGAWTQARRGQVIACEQVGADWLPFRPLMRVGALDALGLPREEAVWTSRVHAGEWRLPGGSTQHALAL